MAFHTGIGFSQKLNTKEAAIEAAEQAKLLLQQKKVDLAVVFSTIHYSSQEFLVLIKDILGTNQIVGCSTAGILTSNLIATRGISVVALTSDDVHFAIGCIDNITSQDLRMAGNSLAKNVTEHYGQHRRQAFVFFSDGVLTDSSVILKGIQDVFGNAFPIIGAGSCDDFHFKQSHQFCREKTMNNGACGFLIGGHTTIGLGTRHGWKPLGKPRFVDRVEHNVIKTIDGKPAASIYQEYFGEKANNLRSTRLGQMSILYPLGIYLPGEDEYLLRNAVSILADGSIVCQGEIPREAEVHIMLSNKESCIQATMDAAMQAQNNLKGTEPKLVIIFESLARHKLLGRAAFQEIKAIKEVFGYTAPLIGIYTYGEICPTRSLEDIDKMHVQNESITILALG
ncbi:MAG: hypothetical protein A2Z88_01600 [Omnitrophica WOR_2 bacterium GWA2_47_8]|nr:MAG: hypothetical protein A2Z88_01600 [Omnitrophica WOR_2 bacterium GWA2_47_8]